jgi:hypothetical protein
MNDTNRAAYHFDRANEVADRIKNASTPETKRDLILLALAHLSTAMSIPTPKNIATTTRGQYV